jgi:hypothetical protein
MQKDYKGKHSRRDTHDPRTGSGMGERRWMTDEAL